MLKKEYIVYMKSGESFLVKQSEKKMWIKQFPKNMCKQIIDIQESYI